MAQTGDWQSDAGHNPTLEGFVSICGNFPLGHPTALLISPTGGAGSRGIPV